MAEQRIHTQLPQKVFIKLLGLQYIIVYKKGADNRVVDALSRKPLSYPQCAAISSCSPQWIDEIVQGYQLDPVSLSLLTRLAIDPTAVPDYSLHSGLLMYKDRIWVGDNKDLPIKLL